MREIVIYHHLGLGDCIESNGIVRHYSNLYDKVFVFSKKRFEEIMKYMYSDIPNVEIVTINSDIYHTEKQEVSDFMRNHTNLLLIGHDFYFNRLQHYSDLQYSCSEAFYDIAGLDYRLKYENFYFPRDNKEEDRVFKKLNPNNEKYIFVHDDPSRGFEIKINSNYKIIKNDVSENIFYMLKILENAEEIHCMSSSILCLIDCLSEKIQFKELLLYSNIRSVFAGPNSISKQWKKV
jgi:hypothetical protein